MHFRHALLSFMLGLCCADIVTAQHTLWRRSDPAPASTPASNNPPPSSSVTKSTRNAGKGSPKTTRKDSTRTNGEGASPTHTPAKSDNNSDSQNSTITKEEKDEELPIKPSITPAIGIVGVVLIITGVGYCLIGIKHEWLLVFLSAGYLASLAVTVLIIYVMTPPVSDAVQGAYFVAAFMTGLIFGGLALIFKEVTGGFGCLVGGFCLSMWVLCLRPGGLITSTTGKAVMIGVTSVVGWSLAFSKYTRNYGSIFCTSFAGAMIAIIGIDCFSRAGLKEFWIYIWGLNDNEFPLHTTTYPITRGMRAELACTIVLCLIGLISQIKVWKVVKERKKKKEEERLQDESSRDKRDSRYGKRIESRNSRALAAWEAVYGDRDSQALKGESGTDTTIDSLKKSTSVREREIDGLELDEMDMSMKQGSTGNYTSSASPRVAEGEGTPSAAPGLALNLDYNNGESSLWWDGLSSLGASPGGSKKNSIDQHGATEPPIPPLPFSPFMEQDGGAKYGERSRGASPMPVQKSREVPLSDRELEQEDRPSFEINRIEDDRASSIAATADEDPDFDALSTKRHSMWSLAASIRSAGDPMDPVPPMPPMPHNDSIGGQGMPESPAETPMDEKDNEELIQPLSSTRETNAKTRKEDNGSKQKAEVATPVELKDSNLPPAISKVAHVYRTNEWAKHIAEADQPEILDEFNADEPAIHVDVGRTEEPPRPVDMRALSPDEMQPQLFRVASSPYKRNPDENRRSSSGGTPIYAFQRQNSAASLNQTRREVRSPSRAWVEQPLVESPTEDGLPMPINLMDERNARVELKPITTNFNGITSPSNPNLILSSAPTSGPVIGADVDLERRTSNALADHRRTSAQNRPSTSRVASSTSQNLVYDSHQPKRFNSVNQIKQNAMLTQWRHSLQAESFAEPNQSAAQWARQSMIDQLRYKDYQEFKQESEKRRRQSQMDMAMRTSQLTDKHRSAMKKMQAQVNETSKS